MSKPVSEPVGVAVIGPGKVAHTHALAVKGYARARLVAVSGRDPEKTGAFAAQYGVKAYTDLRALVADPAVQAVLVTTPHPAHVEAAVVAAEAGVHVLVEKPMATTVADCERMIRAAQAGGVRLGVISQRRWYPPAQRVHAAIEEGRIGKPILAIVTVLGWRGPEYYALDPWRGKWGAEGGGVLVNQTSHQLDLLRWLMGPIAELTGYWSNLNHPYIEVEDTAVAILRFASGALGSLVVSNSQNPGLYGKIHIFGENGAAVGVQTDGGSMFVSGVSTDIEPPYNDLWTIPGEADQLPQWQADDQARGVDVGTYYHGRQIEDFIDAILDGRPPRVTGEDGRNAVEIFEAVYRSQRVGRPVRFPLLG
jgi:UDP-N-acetyl-2-amino-2-deoxyglucuronate dehydrogenase